MLLIPQKPPTLPWAALYQEATFPITAGSPQSAPP